MLEDDRHRALDAHLDISVVVATRNRADLLAITLGHLATQDVGARSWEVIVVDNGSTDATASVLDAHSDRLPLVALHHPEAGKNRALNRALGVARGDLLVFTDDDVAMPADWLQTMAEAAERWPQENIFGGPVVPRFPPGTPPWMTRPDFEHTRWAFSGYHPRETEGPTWQTPLGPNMAIRREAMPASAYDESIGPAGVNYVMGSEVELLLRMYREGEQFIFIPTAPVEHLLTKGHVSFENVMTRARRYGRSEAHLSSGAPTYPLFAVSPYRWGQLGAATARWIRTRLRGEGERRTAELELAAAGATVREQFLLWREGRGVENGDSVRLMPSGAMVFRLLRRRGLFGLARSAARRVVSPLVRADTVQLYSASLDAIPTEERVEKDLDIIVCHNMSASLAARRLICPMRIMIPEEIEARLAAGHAVAIATANGETVGYAWACFENHYVAGIDQTLRIGVDEVCAYDGFVRSDSRGQGILPQLDRAQMEFARALGKKRQLTYALRQNQSSNRSMVRMGKSPLLEVKSVAWPFLKRRKWKSSDPTAFEALFFA